LARNNYFNTGDHFSEWHRTIPGVGYIDLDCLPICIHCKRVLAVIETAFDVGQTFKTTTVTEEVARALKVPALLVLYTPGTRLDEIISIRYKRLVPVKDKEFSQMWSNEFEEFFLKLQNGCGCQA
jgi:hypothetical protein